MLTMETFVSAKKYHRALLRTYDGEPMPEKSWSLTKPGLERVFFPLDLAIRGLSNRRLLPPDLYKLASRTYTYGSQ